jgi:hypothetical protein
MERYETSTVVRDIIGKRHKSVSSKLTSPKPASFLGVTKVNVVVYIIENSHTTPMAVK